MRFYWNFCFNLSSLHSHVCKYKANRKPHNLFEENEIKFFVFFSFSLLQVVFN